MRKRLAVVLPFLLLTSGAIWWGAPQGAAQQQGLRCDLRDTQPEHPLELNTVVSDPRTSQFATPLVKHVVMEKVIYDCTENPGTPDAREFIRDVETFIEIIQRVQGGRTTTVEKRVEEIVCDKGNLGGFQFGAQCSVRDVPLEEGLGDVDCLRPRPDQVGAFAVQPTDPVEMDTVLTSRQDTVKTFKVEKDHLQCSAPVLFRFGYFYLFTEIIEQRVAAGGVDTIRPTEKKFQAILCLVDPAADITGVVMTCRHFIPTAPPPPA